MQPPYQQYPNTTPDPTRYPRPLDPTQAAYTSRRYETTEPGSSPYPYNPYDVPPPPPPEWYMQQRTSKLWKVVIPVFILLIGSIIGILLYPVLATMLSPSHVSTEKPTPFVPFGMSTTPTIPVATTTKSTQNTTAPPYQQDLGSGNSDLFVHAFSQALTYQDTNSLAAHADTLKFLEVCHSALGSCANGWDIFSVHLTKDMLELSADAYAHMTNKAPRPDVSTLECPSYSGGCYYLVGSYENKSSDIPVVHYGTAIFSFSGCCGGSGRTFIWESVDLYG